MATKKDFQYDSGYKERPLTFESDKIVFSKDGETFQVMMDWETPIMKRSAEWVTNGGKAQSVLEIGYGMGIAASFIQGYQPDQHTIMELHPRVAERAEEYANQRNKYYSRSKATAHKRVTIMGGKDWYTEFQKDFGKSGLQEFDAIFIDTYNDNNLYKLKEYITKMLKTGGRMTWWNPMEDRLPDTDIRKARGIEYEMIKMSDHKITIPTNNYHNTNVYYMPMYIRQ
jgi:protein arginine N-methyltransferase 2